MRSPRAGVSASYLLWPLLLTLRSREVVLERAAGKAELRMNTVSEYPAASNRALLLVPVRRIRRR
jgi:hypothetical protein